MIASRWSSRWGWIHRAEAWDAELDRQKRLRQVEAVQEMAEHLGHSSVSLTLSTYSHVLPTLQKDAVHTRGHLLRTS